MTLDEATIAEYEAVAQEAQTMTFLPRAPELQLAAIKTIDDFLPTLANKKEAYVQASNEDGANQVLAMELALGAIRAELDMWLKLKQENPEGAWDDLVTCQDLLAAAIAVWHQVEADATRLENVLRKLLFIERYVFPPQMFNSFGGTVSHRECSICAGDYENCDHIRGRAYRGRLCYTIVRELTQIKEVSMVFNPEDKRCRVTHFSDCGRMRNKMTWRLENGLGVNVGGV